MTMTKKVFTSAEQLLHNYKEDKNIPQIITSIVDLDFYKISMLYYFFKNESKTLSEWKFFNRGKHKFCQNFKKEFKKQVEGIGKLRFTEEEIDFLRDRATHNGKCYFDETFFTFLRGFKLDSNDVNIVQIEDDLEITITGLHYGNTLWETLLMSTMTELKHIMNYEMPNETLQEIKCKDIAKFMQFDKNCYGAKVSDFSTRRRYSYARQELMLMTMKEQDCCSGTSNVHFAHKLGMRHTGTMAHELVQLCAVRNGVMSANAHMLSSWLNCFPTALGIGLTDTFGTENFLKSFDELHAKNFSGLRHDSGDPKEWATRIVEHYKSINVDHSNKILIFSDGISNVDTVREIKKHCDKLGILCSFGIGTYLGNDLKGIDSMNIVIKLTRVLIPNKQQWLYTCKVSDNPEKTTCIDKNTERLYKYQLGMTDIL